MDSFPRLGMSFPLCTNSLTLISALNAQGMQFFRFIFLKQVWNKDKKTLAEHLAFMASLGQEPATTSSPEAAAPTSAIRGVKNKILLLIFPEGTLVSELTRPKSQAFADKQGIPACTNLLLPRSTGLLFCLRSLAADVPDLKLVVSLVAGNTY